MYVLYFRVSGTRYLKTFLYLFNNIFEFVKVQGNVLVVQSIQKTAATLAHELESTVLIEIS